MMSTITFLMVMQMWFKGVDVNHLGFTNACILILLVVDILIGIVKIIREA